MSTVIDLGVHDLDPLSQETVLPNVLRRWAAEQPEAVFLRDAELGTTVTYREFDDLVATWASVLHGLGVAAGEAVVTVLPTGVEEVAVWIAAARLGAIEVPLNAAYQGKLLSHMIGNAAARVVVTSEAQLKGVLDVQAALPELRTVVLVDAAARPNPGSAHVTVEGYAQLEAAELTPIVVSVANPWDLACILYTSGTTGPSKGVMVSWAQVLMTVTGCFPTEGFSAQDNWYIPYPLFHMSGKLCIAGAALHGAEAVVRAKFSLSKFWSDVDQYGCTTALLIGSVPQLLMSRAPAADDATHALRNAEIAPMPANGPEFATRFGLRISTVFNMTEISCPLMTGWEEFRQNSVGRVRPGYDVRIVDDFDLPVPAGTIGEIIVRSELPWVLNVGYWRMPDKTAEAWVNGWFHTGDAGYVDEDGYFYFIDRKKDSIRCKGENISSMELEAELGECPGVRECAVIGVPSELGEEDIVAFIVADSAGFDPADVQDFCCRRLPSFMVPRFVTLVDELPKTPTEKVRKPALRDAWDISEAWDSHKADPRV